MAKLNIIVATHGRFGAELVSSAEMIIGKTENVYNLSLLPEKSFEDFMNEAKELFSRIEGPAFALVDLFGGTPCNVLTAMTRQYGHKVVTGISLPIFIGLYMDAVNAEQVDLDELARNCQSLANETVIVTNDQLDSET